MADKQHALKVSILTLDGRFNLEDIELPKNFPLHEELRLRGYTRGAPHAEWNLMTALYGSLPTIDDRLGDLKKRRDEATKLLDTVLQEADAVSTVRAERIHSMWPVCRITQRRNQFLFARDRPGHMARRWFAFTI